MGGMTTGKVIKVLPKVIRRRKTGALESENRLDNQTANPTTRKKNNLKSTLAEQALNDTAIGIVLGRPTRLHLKASRRATNGEPGAPIPFRPSSPPLAVPTTPLFPGLCGASQTTPALSPTLVRVGLH